MKKHSWPGNVRELKNFVERLVIMCPEEKIDGEKTRIILGLPSQASASIREANLPSFTTNDFKEARRLFEREFLQFKLKENEGNISRTAESVGLERSHLHKKLKSLEIIN